ncbi:MAG: M48 family metalloprotease [Pseudomonadota bacterium]
MRRNGRARTRVVPFIVLCIFFLNSCAGLFDKGSIHSSKDALDFPKAPLRNPAVVAYVNNLANTLASHEMPERIGFQKIEVRVLETSRIQGSSDFYSPRIDITRGMLNALTDEAELAALLGHEIGHKVLHKKQTFTARNYNTKDIEYADWSQKREKEADGYGAMLASKAGYDPYALVDYFDRLSKFQKGGIFAWLDETTATHKDFRNRARDLKKFLAKSRLEPGQGVKRSTEYSKALANLKAISTGDSINEIVPGGPHAAIARLTEIENELLDHKRDGTLLSAERFMEIMEELSGLTKFYDLESHANFMKEILSQDSPLWDSEVLAKKISDILILISGLGVGFIPMVGDAVDLHEFLTGRDYFTQSELSFSERVLSAAGLLAGSGPGWRRVANALDETLDDTRLAKKLGRRTIAEADDALKRSSDIFESSVNVKKNCTVLGRYPRYIELANEIGARKFDVPMNVWNKMTAAEKWAANQKFLDRLIRRGDEIILATPVRDIKDLTGYFRHELDYLIQKGYRLNIDGTRMIKP